MTLHEFLAAQSRTYRRAHLLQMRMNELAYESTVEGLSLEAARLRMCGDRIWIVADRYIDTLFAKVAEP